MRSEAATAAVPAEWPRSGLRIGVPHADNQLGQVTGGTSRIKAHADGPPEPTKRYAQHDQGTATPTPSGGGRP